MKNSEFWGDENYTFCLRCLEHELGPITEEFVETHAKCKPVADLDTIKWLILAAEHKGWMDFLEASKRS